VRHPLLKPWLKLLLQLRPKPRQRPQPKPHLLLDVLPNQQVPIQLNPK
jgi:hypothetical protein